MGCPFSNLQRIYRGIRSKTNMNETSDMEATLKMDLQMSAGRFAQAGD